MQLERRETIATLLVGVAAIAYFAYLLPGTLPVLQTPGSVAVLAIVLGAIAFGTLGLDAFGPRWVGIGGAAVTLLLGLAAIIATGRVAAWCLLALYVAMLAMLAIGLTEDMSVAPDRPERHVRRHA